MRKMAFTAVAVWSMVLPNALRAETVAQIVEKAMEAHGGEANLKKYSAASISMKGTVSLFGFELPAEGEIIYQLPSQLRNAVDTNFMGKKMSLLQIYNAGKMRMTMNGDVTPASEAQKNELKQMLYVQELQGLSVLLDEKRFKTTLLNKAENVGDKPVVGILVKSKGMRDVRIFFDKKTYIILKIERKGINLEGKEVEQRLIFQDYKKVDGVLRPTKGEMFMDGKKFMISESISYKHLENVDPKTFEITK